MKKNERLLKELKAQLELKKSLCDKIQKRMSEISSLSDEWSDLMAQLNNERANIYTIKKKIQFALYEHGYLGDESIQITKRIDRPNKG